MQVSGNIVDLINQRIYSGTIICEGERISAIREGAADTGPYILPGLIDAHVHIESSMLVPYEFSRLASVHGTIATVSDPHEIANVLGRRGIDFMVDNSRESPFRFFFGVPSCVPATPFETAGGSINPGDVAELIGREEFRYLSEMMNVPGVLHSSPEVMEKIRLTRAAGKKVDGHCPTLTGQDLKTYIQSGISTDHECTTLAEAEEKIGLGMKILIREGSAARDFTALAPLLDRHPGMCMFCSDDLHPDNLVEGHIDRLVKRALQHGGNLFTTLRAATLTPIEHYGLDCGLLRPGDYADYITVNNLKDFRILSTTIRGQLVACEGRSLLPNRHFTPINSFSPRHCAPEDFAIPAGSGPVRVIVAEDGKLLTRQELVRATVIDGHVVADPDRDILKIAVVNRYNQTATVSVGLIRNFGIRNGAIASSIAHDSHNCIAVGSDDHSLTMAINLLHTHGGGLVVVHDQKSLTLPLPYAGLMSDVDGYQLASRYREMDALIKVMGSPLRAPFMTLSFMALLVIPSLKISDKGLFDGDTFSFTSLQNS